MREDPIWQEIPVIICTSLADSEHVAAAARLAAALSSQAHRSSQTAYDGRQLLSAKSQIPVIGDREQISNRYGITLQSLDALWELLQN